MKIFRNDICYVNIEDIAKYELPEYLEYDKIVCEQDNYAIFTNDESIKYLKTREDIIDYDDICFLDESGLDQKIKEINNCIRIYTESWLNTSVKLDISKYDDNVKKYIMYRDIYCELIDYKKNKEKIDNRIKNLTGQKIRM